jgi:diaminopimelate epimerase
MKITFTKMHGLGNDFVVLDAVSQAIHLTAAQIRSLADRHFGIGCDQILMVEPSRSAGIDFRYRIFNADGDEVEQCGNGARCFMRFILDKGLTQKDSVKVETKSGTIILYAESNQYIRVNMGVPRFCPNEVPALFEGNALQYPVNIGDLTHHVAIVSMGNPHAILIVDNIDTAPVATLGAALESHHCFPKRINVGFMQVVDQQNIRLRVYERGAGETLACGTGACAAAVTGKRLGMLMDAVNVHLAGGNLQIRWSGKENDVVWMLGSATTVFEGSIEI